jgi:hypothetical protein
VEILTLNVVEHTVNNGVQTVKIHRYKIADTLITQFYLHNGLKKTETKTNDVINCGYESLSVITSLSMS